MKPHNVPDYVLKVLENKVDDVVLSLGEQDKAQVKFNNHKISIVKRWSDISLSIFVAKGKQTIATSFESFERVDIDNQIKKLLSFLKHAAENEDYAGIPTGPFKYPRVEIYDKNLLKKDKIISHIEHGLDEAEKHGGKNAAGVLEFIDYKTRLLTSHNVDLEEKGTNAYYSIRVFADENASGYGNAVDTHLKEINTKKIARFAADIAVKAKNPGKIEPGKYPVLFYPYPFSNIIENVGDGCSIYSVESGYSPFEGKMGEKVGAPGFTLIDDHLKPHGLNTESCDEEGSPSKKVTLIQNGVLKNFLHNHSTAQKYKTETTGSAGILAPGPSNLVVQGGEKSSKELMESFSGIVVTNTWYTRFQNYVTGDFSTIPRDGMFLMKNGKILRPLKNIRVSDNLVRICKNIMELSKNTVQQYGWEVNIPVFAPYAVVKGVHITKSTS